MNPINPDKLTLSKWTAVTPHNKEKHFLVTRLYRDPADAVVEVELEAVLTRRTRRLPWQALQDSENWRMGWLSGAV